MNDELKPEVLFDAKKIKGRLDRLIGQLRSKGLTQPPNEAYVHEYSAKIIALYAAAGASSSSKTRLRAWTEDSIRRYLFDQGVPGDNIQRYAIGLQKINAMEPFTNCRTFEMQLQYLEDISPAT